MEGTKRKDEFKAPLPPKRPRRADDPDPEWIRLLPGYAHYYCDKLPQFPSFKQKIESARKFLYEIGLVKDAVLSHDTEVWPDLCSDLYNQPDETRSLWSIAAHQNVHNAFPGPEISFSNKITIGFSKLSPITPLVDLKSGILGKFITIRGAVVRAGNVHPYCQRLTFRCKSCESSFPIEQDGGVFTPPKLCKADDCENGNEKLFNEEENASTTMLVDSRRVRIQDEMSSEIGRIPRTVECLLLGSLASMCSNGDSIVLCGVAKMANRNASTKEANQHQLYIEACSIVQHKQSEFSLGGFFIGFEKKDYMLINKQGLFKLLTASLCPKIYGMEMVKAGLLLSLFGGKRQLEDDGYGDIISRRSDINVFIVRDPSIGKSVLLKSIIDVAPKAAYVCGPGTSAVGLTCFFSKNEGNDYSVEAGLLPMCDFGVALIDEFDKCKPQHPALLEALEQQSVSIAKAGIYRTLSAKATVLCAANPISGHYNPQKTISENVNIDPSLLSRFDLIYILQDRPDKEFDTRLVNHLAGLRGIYQLCVDPTASYKQSESPGPNDGSPTDKPLQCVLKVQPDDKLEIISSSMLRKYIAPKLSPEAADALQAFYMRMRSTYRGPANNPFTARQLESLLRLTEARAKLDLRELCTIQDARDAIELFQFTSESVLSTNKDDKAVFDLPLALILANVPTGRANSVIGRMRKLVKALRYLANKQGNNIFSNDEIKGVAALLGLKGQLNSLIKKLNNEGILLNKGGGTFLLRADDF